MPSTVFRRVDCPCGRTVMLTLGGADPIECACGLDYDPRTGKALPVCETIVNIEKGITIPNVLLALAIAAVLVVAVEQLFQVVHQGR